MSHAIEIRGLHYRAGKSFEIPNLDLNVPTGAIYGFLGPNGSGKTTTIRLMLGPAAPAAPATSTCSVARCRARRRGVLARVGYVPEQPAPRPDPHGARGAPLPRGVLPDLGSHLGGQSCW